MIMRIGSPLLNKKAMSHFAIGMVLGINEEQVKEIEKEGIRLYSELAFRTNGKTNAQNKSIITDALNAVVDNKDKTGEV